MATHSRLDMLFPSCDHSRSFFAVRTLSNGQLRYVKQCEVCGSQLETLTKTSAKAIQIDLGDDVFSPWDETRSDRYWARRRAEEHEWRERQRREEQEAWLDRHNAYLQSDDWRQRRLARFAIDRGRCQAKLPGCTGIASQVHHLTYDHWGNEPLFDLASVCRPCHESITRMDRERRGAA